MAKRKTTDIKIKGMITLDRIPFKGKEGREWYAPLKSSHPDKIYAQAEARVVRKFGIKARVLKTDKGFKVYCNENDLKRADARGILKEKKGVR